MADLTSDDELKEADITAYSVTLDGEVLELATTGKGSSIVRFASDGKISNKIKIDIPHVVISNLAVLSPTRYLVSGTEFVTSTIGAAADLPPKSKLFTGLIDQNGILVKRLTLPGDINIENQSNLDYQIGLGSAVSGRDGTAYLFRRGEKGAIIYVLDASGGLSRKLTIPEPAAGMHAASINAGDGRIAVEFIKSSEGPDETLIAIVSAEDGKLISLYVPPAETGNAIGCYGLEGLTFLKAQDQHFVIVRARAR